MDISGWTKTRLGRRIYARKPHLFGVRALMRILGNLIHDNQISPYEREQLANMLYPARYYIIEGKQDRLSLFQEVRKFLTEKVFPEFDLALPLVTWLVDLEIEAVTEFLRNWSKKFNGGTSNE